MVCFTNVRFPGETAGFDTLVIEGDTIAHLGKGVPEGIRNAEDLGGASIVPAFHDTHLHFSAASYFNGNLDVSEASDIETLLSLFRIVAGGDSRTPVIGFGFSRHAIREGRVITRTDLDAVPAPVFLAKYDGHAAVMNTAMIRKMPKAVQESPDFDKETGWAFGTAFYEATSRTTRTVGPLSLASGMLAYAKELAGKGIGFLHAAEGMGYPFDLDVDAVRLIAKGIPQEMRIWFQTFDVARARRRNMEWLGGCFETALDGCFGSKDAALFDPYTDAPDNRGMLFHDQATVDRMVEQAHRSGLQVSLHAIGDRAVEQALVAFENAQKRHPREDARHSIIHADLASPSQIERMARLGLGLLVQPAFLDWPQEPASYLETILGDRVERLIPMKSCLSAGIPVSGGSDAPCTTPDPIRSMATCLNHPNPDERLSLGDALDVHTRHAAWLTRSEDRTGSIAVGMAADLAILDGPLTEERLPGEKRPEVSRLYLKGRPVTERMFDGSCAFRKVLGKA